MNSEIFGLNLIVSKSNSTIVKIGKLNDKKYRMNEKLFICNGIKLFLETINYDVEIEYIVINNSTKFSIEVIEKIKTLQEKGITILCVSDEVFNKISEELSPQGIITVCSFYNKKHKFLNSIDSVYDNDKIMMFESIRDPGNMGTIIRTATAFGINKLIFSSDCADLYSSKVIRASMGAIFKTDIYIVDDICRTIELLKNSRKRVLGAALRKESLVLGKSKIKNNDVIIIGNEGHGLSSDVLELCDNTLYIPMCENTESLNAAIAAGIIMWEFLK